jgi:hypothetical protein
MAEEPGRGTAGGRDGAPHDPSGTRRLRVDALRDLVARRAYDVPAEAIAASIIRDALVVPLPAPGEAR